MNTVFINNHHVIEVIVDGDQTIATVDDIVKQVHDLADKQHHAKKPVYVLCNLLKYGAASPETRKRAVHYAKITPTEKFALVGNGGHQLFSGNLWLQATGKGDKAKYFEDYDDAIQWILHKD